MTDFFIIEAGIFSGLLNTDVKKSIGSDRIPKEFLRIRYPELNRHACPFQSGWAVRSGITLAVLRDARYRPQPYSTGQITHLQHKHQAHLGVN